MMKTLFSKMMVAGLALALFSICLMGCEPSKDTEGPISLTVKDADGNVYPTMKIGQQIWMAKNLNVKTEGSKCYDNNPANCEKYGRLYTWADAKKVCPAGWHLPSREEFDSFLEAVLVRVVDQNVSQKKLDAETLKKGKEDFFKHLRVASWKDGFDTFGFSALPAGGFYSYRKEFLQLDDDANFWSSTKSNECPDIVCFESYKYCEFPSGKYDCAYSLNIFDNGARVSFDYPYDGYSVRCLKDIN